MGTFTVIDAKGKWVVNPHAFPFVDPSTKVRFEPGHPMKVACDEGSWLAGQMEAGVLKAAPDPVEAPPKAVAPPATAAKAAKA